MSFYPVGPGGYPPGREFAPDEDSKSRHDLRAHSQGRYLSGSQLRAAKKLYPELVEKRDGVTSLVEAAVLDRVLQEQLSKNYGILRKGPAYKLNCTVIKKGKTPGHPGIDPFEKGTQKYNAITKA